MNKAQLAKAVTDEACNQTGRNISRSLVSQIIEVTLDTIKTTTADGEKVNLRGFGAFRQRERHERQGRNPRNGDAVTIKASKTLVFKVSKPSKKTPAAG